MDLYRWTSTSGSAAVYDNYLCMTMGYQSGFVPYHNPSLIFLIPEDPFSTNGLLSLIRVHLSNDLIFRMILINLKEHWNLYAAMVIRCILDQALSLFQLVLHQN
ncbi:hypothetical protein Tco_1581801 [Tanacetum coccineum]